MIQRVSDPFLAVPFQGVEIILYRVVAILARNDIEGFEDLLLVREAVDLLQIPEQIVHLGIVDGLAPATPRQRRRKVDPLRQEIAAEFAAQVGIVAQRHDAVLKAVLDLAVFVPLQRISDFLTGLRHIFRSSLVCIGRDNPS